MTRFSFAFILVLIIQYAPLFGQTTRISVELQIIDKDYLQVTVQPPRDNQSDWTFVIPEIIPGTYMKINLERYYRKFKAYDTDDNSMKIKQKDNFIYIKGKGNHLSKLTFQVHQSLGKGPIWDAMITCGGSVFSDDGYLMNAQMLSGYFEGYEQSPFEISFVKSRPMYGATSMKNLSRSDQKDVFYAANYYDWIDSPILYSAQVDTTHFIVNDRRFIVATHAELELAKSRYMATAAKKTMQAVDSFAGFNHEGDYYFLFYHVDYNRLKGLVKGFGLGSALEHKNSSAYFFSDYAYDTTFASQSHIISHEYYHTLAPLNLHSEKIRDFSFAEPDMSRHLWLYEGSTDYLATLNNVVYGLNFRTFQEDMARSIEFSEKRKERGLNESSQHIVKSSVFNWPSKILQLMNFYEQGKFLAFAIDVELASRTNGQKRWIDVVKNLLDEYKEEPFDDAALRDILVKHTYPEFGEFYDRHIVQGVKPDYDHYLNMLGWQYLAEKKKIPAYATKWIVPYYYDTQSYYIRKVGKNTLGIQEGDTLVSINGIPATMENRTRYEQLFPSLYYPDKEGDTIELRVRREGQEVILNGAATLSRKSPVHKIIPADQLSEEQKALRDLFFSKTR